MAKDKKEKRKREVGDDQGGNPDKKAHATRADPDPPPGNLPFSASFTLTAWDYHPDMVHAARRAIEREIRERVPLESLHALKRQLHTSAAGEPARREVKHGPVAPGADVPGDRRARPPGRPSPADAMGPVRDAQEECLALLRHRLATMTHLPQLLFQLRRDVGDVLHRLCPVTSALSSRQTQFEWDAGEGRCTALCYEFLQWRIAGVLPELILPVFAKATSKARIDRVYAIGEAKWCRHAALSRDAKADSRLLGQVATHLKYLYDTPFDAMRASLLKEAAGFPRRFAPAQLTLETTPEALYPGIIPDVSLEAIAAMWPEGTLMPPVLQPFRDAGGIYPQPGLESDSQSSSSRSSLAAPHPRVPATARQQAWHAAIGRDVDAWHVKVTSLRDRILQKPAHPFSVLLLTFKHDGDAGHAIALDWSLASPGIYDPNLGFLRVPAGASPVPYLGWLLALFSFYYHVDYLCSLHLA